MSTPANILVVLNLLAPFSKLLFSFPLIGGEIRRKWAQPATSWS